MKVFLLEHAYEYGKENEHTEIKTIGIYENEALAEKAVEHYKELPGFCEFGEECFHINGYELNEGHWSEGFIDTDEE